MAAQAPCEVTQYTCREMTLPIAKELNIPGENVFANRINWQVDESTGLVEKMVGFDERELTSRQGGKPAAIARLRGALSFSAAPSCAAPLCAGPCVLLLHHSRRHAAVVACRNEWV